MIESTKPKKKMRDSDLDHNCGKSDAAIAWAKENGLRCDLPGPYELFIDLDGGRSEYEFEDRYPDLQLLYPKATYVKTPSRTPMNYHVRVQLGCDTERPPLTPLERVALQAICGSHTMRELLALKNYNQGDDTLSLFFEEEPTNG